MNGKTVQIATYRDESYQPIAQKIRFPNKDMLILGDGKEMGLYGQHLWRDGGRRVVITEGEIDALSVSQLQGNKWPVVSIPKGAAGAKKALKKELEWLEKFDEIVLMFDNDDAGQEAIEECSEIGFTPGKLKVARLPLKDANEMLVAGRGAEVINAIFGAKAHRPDGIIAGVEMWDQINEDADEFSFELPFHQLGEMSLGIRAGELWTFTAGSGIGKSAIVREIGYHLIKSQVTTGFIMLEENTTRTARGFIGLHLNKPAHLRKVWADLTEQEKRDGFDAVLGTNKVFLYDHFGSSDVETLVAKIRFMAAGCDCKVIVLDHLSIVVSGTEDGDERRMIDNFMTAIKTVAMELNIAILLVSHLKRPPGDRGHEEGARTSLAQLRGSHAIAQLSDFVIGAERDQQGDNKNVTTLRILKNRYTGETGEAGWLEYSQDTGRLTELTENPFKETKDASSYDFTSEGDDLPF